MSDLKEAIKKRTSIRAFDGRRLSNADMDKVAEVINVVDNPFNVPVEFRILDKKHYDLSSPVITGENTYIAAKSTPQENWEMAYGYSFGKLILLLEEMGLGTTILAATLKRKAFEEAMDLEGSQVMPAVTPIGYPASKRSMREKLLRKAIKADERLPFDSLFFDQSFETPLNKEDAREFLEALELMRLAPSAGNKQPWRAVVDQDTVHFYKDSTKNLGESDLGDVQKMDVGIALAAFDMTMKENGAEGEFVFEDPGLKTNDKTEYIVSYRLKNSNNF